MKLACQENLVPGDTFAEKLKKLEKYGFEGVELNGSNLLEPGGLDERVAALKDSPVAASSICGGSTPEYVSPDPGLRRTAIDSMKKMLDAAAETGAVGAISVPIFNRSPRVPDLSPFMGQHALEMELLVAVLKELAPHAEQVGAAVLLEPLNRYESNSLKDIEEGAAICRRVGSPGIKLMADFFHMHIEQPNMAKSLTSVKDVLVHCHLADNTRQEPGSGCTDFKTPFQALKRAKFKGFMALECGLSGPADKALPKCVRYLKSCMA